MTKTKNEERGGVVDTLAELQGRLTRRRATLDAGSLNPKRRRELERRVATLEADIKDSQARAEQGRRGWNEDASWALDGLDMAML